MSTIKFEKPACAVGRNGRIKCSGLEISKLRDPNELFIVPITGQGHLAKGLSLRLSVEDARTFAQAILEATFDDFARKALVVHPIKPDVDKA
jgi:hypothetical protein